MTDVEQPLPDSPSRSSLARRIVLAVTVLAVVLGLVMDRGTADVEVVDVATASAVPTVGSSTCAVLAVEGGGDAIVALAGAPTDDGEGDDGEGTVAVLKLADEDEVLLDGPTPDVSVVGVDGAVTDAAVTARWEQRGVLLARRVTAPEGARVVGSAEGPCPAEPAPSWVVPGVATAGGASATLVLANPTVATASVTVTLTTPDGRIEPTRLANVVVPAGRSTSLDLNDFAPEQPDLGVEVTARSGRVVVEAVQTFEAAVGGVDGRSLVVAHTAQAEVWTVPWVETADDQSAWLWVTNVGDRSTDVRLVVHGPAGPVVPPGAGVTLAPGTTQRIDLRGAVADLGPAAVTVRSAPGTPILVSGAVLRAAPGEGEDGEATEAEATDDGDAGADEGEESEVVSEGEPAAAARGGIAVVEAVAASSDPIAAVVTAGDGRPTAAVVANPGEAPAVVEIAIVDASGTSSIVSSSTTVAPGSVVVVDLTDALLGEAVVLVTPQEGAVTAALVTESSAPPLELTAIAARPFAPAVDVLVDGARRDRGLLHPIDLGPTPAPTPAPDPDEVVPTTGS